MRTLIAVFVATLIAAGPASASSYEAGKKFLDRADYRGAAIAFSAAAARGDARAQYELAKLFDGGLGVARDRERARSLYRRASVGLIAAANSGHADARYILSQMYHSGLGVPRDQARALSLLKAAAGQDHADALYQLAVYHEWGVGVSRSEETARYLYRKAADKGSIKARIMLAAHHMTGTMERADESQAIEFLEWAARDGTPDDQFAIAGWYAKKYFGDYGQRAALRLTQKAAQRGHVKAQAHLAKLYQAGGAGLERNPVRAYMWGRLAQRRKNAGQPQSLINTGNRLPSLTRSERESAESWVRQWRPEP